jgi:hypothetical protein
MPMIHISRCTFWSLSILHFLLLFSFLFSLHTSVFFLPLFRCVTFRVRKDPWNAIYGRENVSEEKDIDIIFCSLFCVYVSFSFVSSGIQAVLTIMQPLISRSTHSTGDCLWDSYCILADEALRAQVCPFVQVEERNARHKARSHSISTRFTLGTVSLRY